MIGSTRLPLLRIRGHTLVELVLVVSLIAVAVAIAMPTTTVVAQARVDAAVTEVAQAVRFAQSEAIRTGVDCVVSLDTATGRVRIFQLNRGPTPPIEDVAKPVFYPIAGEKKYDFVLGEMPASTGVKIASAVFTFADSSTTAQLGFSATGNPVNVQGPNPADEIALAGTGKVTIAYGDISSSIIVDAATGRVTQSS